MSDKPNAWDLKNANEQRYPNRPWGRDGVCEICARPADAPTMVEIGVDGYVLDATDPRSQHVDPHSSASQGCFPIGSTCARKLRRPR